MATAEILEAEARERPRAAVVAIVAGAFTLAAAIVGLIVLKHMPRNLIGEAIQRQQHLVGIALSAACSVIGLVAITLTLDFLFCATRRRRPDLPWQLRPLLWAGGAGLVVVLIALQIVMSVKLNHFVHHGSQTYEEATKVNDQGAVAYVGLLAQLAFAGVFVTIVVSAMRVGLLTRFLGYLGAISGVLFVIPFVPIPIVQVYWLGALAMLFLGRSPSGTPPAWQSGEAIPWPSHAELREQRVRDAEARRGSADDGERVEGSASEPAPAAPAARRKRKKRR